MWKLEELQNNSSSNYEIISNTLQIISPNNIDCNKPLIIKSNSLNTNNPTENTWQIDLKNNNSQWKEVGTIGKNKWGNWAITYEFKDNKQYRVFYNWYNWSENDYIKIIKEFIFNLPIGTNEITSFQDGDTHQVLTLRFGKDLTIYAIKGNLFKR